MSSKQWLAYFPELDTSAELTELVEAVSGRFTPRQRLRELIRAQSQEAWPFLEFALDLSQSGLMSFVDELDRDHALAKNDAVVYGLLKPLLGMLQDQLIRTLVTELHAEELEGESPEARFQFFVRRIATTEYQASFRARFPVLISDLDRITRNYRAYLLEILAAVRADLPVLGAVSSAVAPDDLVVSIGTGNGDLHRRGRSVAIVEFASGAKIVYKPRSLRVDQQFQALLRRLNETLGLELYTPRVLTYEDHGWMEFVEYTALDGETATREYYRKIGYLTAVLYALDTCDIHHENVICHRGSPVLIDLETMFHPAIGADDQGPKSATAKIGERLTRSVTSIGILPTVIGTGDAGADIGGIGFENGQESPFKGFSFVHYGRDDMRISFERQSYDTTSTVPAMSSQSLSPAAVSQAVRDGFAKVGTWIMGNRKGFVSLVEDLFADVEIRYLHNPTFFYGQLLRMSTHPDLLGDPMSRHVLLHRVALRRRKSPPAFSRAEHRDLSQGDVPHFTARTGSTELFDSFGDSLGDVLELAPLRLVAAKVAALDERERDAQLS